MSVDKSSPLSAEWQGANRRGRRLLYHCIPVEPEGDAIRTSANYGTAIPVAVKEKLGIAGDPQKTPLVFASPYASKALAFGLLGADNEKLLNSEILDTDGEFVLICDREKTMRRNRVAILYAFEDEGFVDLPNASRQAVSIRPVPFARTHVALVAKSAEDLMRAGLQIFSFKESLTELAHFDIGNEMEIRKCSSLEELLGGLVREGKVTWENHSRNIEPSPVLGQRLGIPLPEYSQAAAPPAP